MSKWNLITSVLHREKATFKTALAVSAVCLGYAALQSTFRAGVESGMIQKEEEMHRQMNEILENGMRNQEKYMRQQINKIG